MLRMELQAEVAAAGDASAWEQSRFREEAGFDASDRERLLGWQKNMGLEPTGVLDLATVLWSVYSSREEKACRMARKLNQELAFYLRDDPSIAATSADPRARAAFIKGWQAQHGLAPTGTIGTATVDAAQRAYRGEAQKGGALARESALAAELNFYTDHAFAVHASESGEQIDAARLAGWQRKYGLEPTGIIDQATLRAAKRHFRGAASERVNDPPSG